MRIFILLILASVAFMGCSKKQYPPFSPDFQYLSKEANGLYSMKSNGFGVNIDSAVIDAQRNAFYHVLFKGIPGTELNVPLIDNEANSKSKHKEYFDKFFEQGGYRAFMLSSSISSDLLKVNGGFQISVDVKINCNSLRKDLEQNQVIRKLGF